MRNINQPSLNNTSFPVRILGIDPGFKVCGWGIVDVWLNKRISIAGGIIKNQYKQPDDKLSKNITSIRNIKMLQQSTPQSYHSRLADLSLYIKDLCRTYKPDVSSMETVYVNSNAQTSLLLSQTRGAIVAAVGECNIELFDYAPRTIKKTITGSGSADKSLVSKMVTVFLPELKLLKSMTADQSDAYAVALCHAQHNGW